MQLFDANRVVRTLFAVIDFEVIRNRFVASASALENRLDRLEPVARDLEEILGASGNPSARLRHFAVMLEDRVDSISSELDQVRSALRRIASREYDVCLGCGSTLPRHLLERLPYSVNCSPCSRTFPLDYSEQLSTQHAELRRQIKQLSSILESAALCSESRELARLKWKATSLLLADFEGELDEHFKNEEQDGYLAEALAAAPQLTRQAVALERQHADFRERSRALTRLGNGNGEIPDHWGYLRNRFDALGRDLLTHENAEGDLISTAFGVDIGAGD